MNGERLCPDCGEWFRFTGYPDNTQPLLCGPCEWIRNTDDPAERKRIREMTHRRRMD